MKPLGEVMDTATIDADSAECVVEQIKVRVLPDGRMDRVNAAKYVGRAPKTLAMWVSQSKGPKFHRVGGRVFYFLHDLDAFIQAGAQS